MNKKEVGIKYNQGMELIKLLDEIGREVLLSAGVKYGTLDIDLVFQPCNENGEPASNDIRFNANVRVGFGDLEEWEIRRMPRPEANREKER